MNFTSILTKTEISILSKCGLNVCRINKICETYNTSFSDIKKEINGYSYAIMDNDISVLSDIYDCGYFKIDTLFSKISNSKSNIRASVIINTLKDKDKLNILKERMHIITIIINKKLN
jgi:hypothetical protein